MRVASALAALAILMATVDARADDSEPAPAPASAPASAPAPAPAPAPASASASAPASASAGDLDAVREVLARQALQLDALRADVDATRRPPPAFTVHFSGFLQVDWIVHDQASQNQINDSDGQLINQDRFTLRRGHLRAEAERGPFSAALEVDANTTNGPQVRPIDAEVSVRWPEKPDARLPSLEATAGLLRIPFGFEVQELDWVRPFLERATALQALFPGEYDLGARLRARYRFLDWAIAVMNGSPIGSKSFPDVDPVHQKDLVGRLGVDVALAPGVRFRAGASLESGTGLHAGTPTTKDVVVWQDANGDGVVQPGEITVIPGSSATPSRTFRRFAIGGDAGLEIQIPVLGLLALRAELIDGSNLDRGLEVADPVSAGRDLRETGWYLGLTQELTRWVILGARYDRYNPDADASAQQGAALVPVDRSYGTLALMGMVHIGAQRLLVEYDANTNPLGIAPGGAPTTLADSTLTLRAQAAF